ncbi:MAG: exodeoxyribonuclease III [Bacilli bacterium]|nr:exodeoxyribonuclease III [Bacilli bacterium]
MRFASWNVNGIRAVLKKDFDKSFEALDADIIGLQESKWSEDSHDAFPFMPEGYHTYWTVSKLRKGYSGVTVFARIEPLSVHYGLLGGKYDDEGRVITLEYDSFYFVCAYVPNAGDGLKRLDFRMGFEEDLKAYFRSLNKPIVYCGDLNVAHRPIDLKNPESNTHNPGYTPEEREKMTLLLKEGYVDTFRLLYPDQVKYSWWSYRFHARENNAGWRIDYFLVSEAIKNKVKEATIENDVYGSDHCPVTLEIEL